MLPAAFVLTISRFPPAFAGMCLVVNRHISTLGGVGDIMLRTILGSVIGGLMAGAVALGVSAQMRPAAAPIGVDLNNPYAMTVANTGALGQGAAVQCQPYQEPVIRRVIMGGREVAEVTCATAMAAQPAYYASAQPYASDIVAMPAPRPRAAARPVAARQRVVSGQATQTRDDDRREGRSWGKTAMIIGGSSGAGAGIGGLIGGKKGALIGAAVGGGAATIYESTKR